MTRRSDRMAAVAAAVTGSRRLNAMLQSQLTDYPLRVFLVAGMSHRTLAAGLPAFPFEKDAADA